MSASMSPVSFRLLSRQVRLLSRLNTCTTKYKIVKYGRLYSSKPNILTFQERGLFNDILPAVDDDLPKRLNSAPQCMYCGFDPTADSLHIGNLLAIIALIHCQRGGHQPIALIGGATALIGDPSGKTTARELLKAEEAEANVSSIEESLQRIFTNHERFLWKEQRNLKRVKILNNYDWYHEKNVIKFLVAVGRHLKLNTMLSKSSVQSRLDSVDGMTFAEFSYQVFQAYDFLYLNQNHNCLIQIGGSDQLGNIQSGYHLIKKITGNEVYGITLPLITSSTGDKLGKSEGNAVWINPDKTTPFELYQHFLRVQDADVERYLKLFTFLSLREIEIVMKRHKKNLEMREAQKLLAQQVLLLVHGDEGLNQAVRLTRALYQSSISSLSNLSQEELNSLFKGTPVFDLMLEPGITVYDLGKKINCIPEGVGGLHVIETGGFYVNQQRVTTPETVLQKGLHILGNGITLIRIGKKKYYIVRWI